MTIIDKIEKSFQTASSIEFHPSRDLEKEPSVIILVFDKERAGADTYNLLLDNYGNKELVIVISPSKSTLDISFVSKKTADTINLKNLRYDKNQLESFLAIQPKNECFVFAIGFNSNGKLVLTATREPFSPLLIYKYEITVK